jgi:hypothetical protein
MPGKGRYSISDSVLPFAEVQKWERLVPGTAPQLASELVRSAKHQRMMRWAQFAVGAIVRISACAVALYMARGHAITFAALPAALALIGDPIKYPLS